MAAALAALVLGVALAAPRYPAFAQDQAQPATPPTPAAEKPADQPAASTPPAATEQPAAAPATPPAAQPAEKAAETKPEAAAEAQGFTLHGILYDDFSVFIFILVTIVMGGAAGYSTGKAIAQTWRPGWHLIASALVLGIAVRFIHYALFGASFLTPHYYLIDTLLVLLATFAGFRLTRVRQMTSRYRWLYQAKGPFGWKASDPRSGEASSA